MTAPVLVVDDNGDNRKLLAWILEDEGYPFVEADCGETALEILGSSKVSAVLLDIQLPGISGVEVLKTLRQDPRTQDTPVMALTALAAPEKVEVLCDLGFDKVVSKPLDEDEVLAWLAKIPGLEEAR